MILYDQEVYKKDSKGRWRISKVLVIKDNSSANPMIRRISGLIDGKKVTVEETVSATKSKDTLVDQAIFKAQSVINKKLKEGYTDSMEDNSILFLPMLVQDYTKNSKKIKFPAYVQPKLDGIRATLRNGQEFWSRKNTPFYYMESVLDKLWKKKPPKNIHWDGELYIHGMPLQDLNSIVRQQKKKPSKELLDKISYYIYDLYDTEDPDMTYDQRLELIDKYVKPENIVDTSVVKNDSDVKSCHQKYTKSGFEGVIIRNATGKYKPNYRSPDIQKFKTFEDSEFEIVDFKEGTGRDSGTIVFILKTPEGEQFSCRPKGTLHERKKAFENGVYYIGKSVTVKYQELNKYTGKPIFPVCSLEPREH